MSTKTKTETEKSGEQKTTFDPTSMGAFQQLQNPFVKALLQYLDAPARQTQENLRIGQGERAIGTAFGTQQQNLIQNALALGMPSAVAPGYFQSQLARSGRARAGASAQNVIQNKFLTDQIRRSMLPLAAAYRPLQTGGTFQSQGTTTQTTGGLGTWLPQVMGGALGLATGGLSSLMGAGVGAAGLAGGTGVGSSAWGLGQSPLQAQLPRYPGFGGGQ